MTETPTDVKIMGPGWGRIRDTLHHMPWTERLPNGLYRGFWRDEFGKKRSKSGFTQRAAALRYAGEQESKVRRGEATTGGRTPTWSEWKAEWLKLRRVEPSTLVEDKIRIDKHIEPVWGEARIGRITREQVQEWVNALEATGMAAGTVRRVYYTFSASMTDALRRNRIPATPCTLIELPTPAEKMERFLTRGEFDMAVANMDEPWRSAAIVLVGTGLRFAELAGLHWARVDFEQQQITVMETFDQDRATIKPYPKPKKPRVVPFPMFAQEALQERLDATMGQEWPHGCGYPHRGTRVKCRSPLVFHDEGEALDDQVMLRQHWQPALKRAGLDTGRTHDLRHTWASWLAQRGIPAQVIQELGGWADMRMVQRYAHFGNTQHKTVREALDGLG